ncbi:hypothetical protein AC623_20610 [Bacillus sp. FJAT-27231]|uniref:ImmA/IrrE family metallo-endopeptidase n=1 Tax=Bacillus sp. FJAT-27231 TaxID=1679168 RepID=UPI00067119CF|nr:ImmA/IrrE family metallo-endopeptidase [Bacillus sp. FJAT-27231]KMY52540.1 hypothetical protein AC623_20610 [Bacillus sp. FJAT-27231]
MSKRNYQSEQTQTAEKVGEAFAHQVLSEQFGAEVFIGSSIEIKLHALAHVIYQDVPENEYSGATITYDTGEIFVALNTHQPLRLRYFTAAHELWHVLRIKDMIDKDIDQERAADRFAAALMMPAPLIRLLWGNLVKGVKPEKAIIMVADMASAPYEAVARRVHELGLLSKSDQKIKDYKDDQWIEFRKSFHFPKSPLDSSLPFTNFTDYERIIEKEVENGELSLLEAATKLSRVSHERAKEFQEEAITSLTSIELEEDAD